MRDYCIMYDLSEIRSDVFPIFFWAWCRHQLFRLPTYCRCYEATFIFFLHAIYCLFSASSLLTWISCTSVRQPTHADETTVMRCLSYLELFRTCVWFNCVPLSREESGEHPSSLSCGSFRRMPHVHYLSPTCTSIFLLAQLLHTLSLLFWINSSPPQIGMGHVYYSHIPLST